MLDRSKQPLIHQIENLQLPEARRHRLDNGILVLENRLGTQEILKLEIIFRAGRPFEKEQLIGRATASMLREGTLSRTASEIAETFDFYGGTFTIPANLDVTNITLYCLTRHFEKLLPIISDLVTQPAFPEHELNAFIDRSVRRLKVDLSRNDIIAYRAITENIFGSDHPYGYNSTPKTYQGLERHQLETHFQETYTAANCTILISGKTTDRTISLLNTYLGRQLPMGHRVKAQVPAINRPAEKLRIEHPDKVQSAIRIGRQLFNRNHADYPGMYVLNTILGGYFGSRLMANIREEKGYTYNIYSAIDPMVFDGYFYIGTEVGKEFTKETISEIYSEIRLLQEEEVGAEEMEMVRNYLMGNLLTMLDGPFNVADVVRTIETDGLPADFFHTLTQTVSKITPAELKDLAQKYLKESDLWEVVVG
ncbi:MAG: insulinase family protein [Saprospiraceae bacterium]|nr:insulinase family protein [Saprospiraceae bacterium]